MKMKTILNTYLSSIFIILLSLIASGQVSSLPKSLEKVKTSMDTFQLARKNLKSEYFNLLQNAYEQSEKSWSKNRDKDENFEQYLQQFSEVKSLTATCINEKIFDSTDSRFLAKHIICYFDRHQLGLQSYHPVVEILLSLGDAAAQACFEELKSTNFDNLNQHASVKIRALCSVIIQNKSILDKSIMELGPNHYIVRNKLLTQGK